MFLNNLFENLKIKTLLLFIATLYFNTIYSQLDITYQRLSLTINPDTTYIEGESIIYFKPTNNTNFILIDLNDTFQILNVKYQNIEIPYTRVNHKINIENNSLFLANRVDSIYIHYKGVPHNFFNANSTNFTKHDSVSIFWTQSQPYGCADWWPTQNNLSDKIDSLDIFVTCPSSNRSASNGLLISDTIIDNQRVSFWKHRYPIVPYLVGISITNYIMYYDTAYYMNDTIPIMNFVFPEYESEYRQNSFATAIMMKYFNNTYGEYPFKKEKYGHAQIPGYGGMENQTITFMSGYSYMLVAHELSHHWFGNYITCYSWEDIWLNEGFATYTSNLILNYEPSPNGFDNWRNYCVNSITSQNDGSVWVNDTNNRSRIFSGRLSYEKGGMLLNMIHHEIGDSLFYLTMKNYLNSSEFSYHFSSTNDFKAILENTTHLNFDHFFNYWFYGEGFPLFSMQAFTSNQNTLSINLKQQNSTFSNFLFKGYVELRIKNSIHDTLISVYIDDEEETYSLALSFSADSVILNPYYHLITPQISITPLKKTSAFIIYPNPTHDDFTFVCMGEKAKKLLIYDVSGRIVFENQFESPQITSKINVSMLKKGLFFVQLIDDKNNIFINNFVKF